jgi:type IV fimbrial biogenesis protein FimT
MRAHGWGFGDNFGRHFRDQFGGHFGNRFEGGFTLVELLVVMAILALLLAAPSFSKQLEDSRQRSHMFELQRLIHLARSNALSTGRETTICGTTDGRRCVADWVNGAIVIFEDRNRNRTVDDSDRLIFQSNMAKVRWHWRGSNRPYLRFSAAGAALEKGHFTLCPNHQGIDQAAQLIVNWVGRVRVARIQRNALPASENCD